MSTKCTSLMIFIALSITDLQVLAKGCSEGRQKDYRGNEATTASGKTCQKWTVQRPHSHTRTVGNYPNTGLGDHNYCRNPDDESGGAWCYTTDPNSRWEYCGIPKICIINGVWSSFGTWTSCSADCGAGTQTRSRTCTNPAPANGGSYCVGSSRKSQPCNTHPCPVITVHSREVGKGTRTTLSCVVSPTFEVVTIAWKSGGNLISAGTGLTPKSGIFSSNSQTATLEIASPSADEAYTCEVTSTNFPSGVSRMKVVNVFVYTATPGNVEVQTGSQATITCSIANIESAGGVTVTWTDGTSTITQGIVTTQVSSKQQTSKLTAANPQSDKVYTCVIISTGYTDSEVYTVEVNLKIFEISTASHDVLAGTASTLTCSVAGVTASITRIVWLDNSGNIYTEQTSDTNYSVVSGKLVQGAQTSTLILLEIVTLAEDQIFTCRITVGEQKQYADTEILLKTFRVSTTNDAVQSGQSATLSCSVINPTDTLTVAWYNETELLQDTAKKAIRYTITVTDLVLDSPERDVNYTCKITGDKEYFFIAEVEVNDLTLKPENETQAFTRTVLTLTCSHIFPTIREGFFTWKYNNRPCLSQACSNPVDTPKTSKLTTTVGSSTVGAWRCFYTELKGNKTMKSNEVKVTEVSPTGTQTPSSVWGVTGTESAVTCSVPHNLTLSSLTSLQWMLDGNVINNYGVGYNKKNEIARFTRTEKVYSDTEVTWQIKFTHSRVAVGTLRCLAQYNTGERIETPGSKLNLMTVTSDVESVTMTPDTGAVVTFVTRAPSKPTTAVEISSGSNAVSLSTEMQSITEGVRLIEVVRFSSLGLPVKVNKMDELFTKEYAYTYSVNNGTTTEISLSGKAFVAGETFVETPVWAAVGKRATFTVYFTALDISSVKVTWQQKRGMNEWTNVTSDGYSTFISGLDKNNVMSTTLVIHKTNSKQSDFTDYRIELKIAGLRQMSNIITVKAATAIVSKITPMFEGAAATFTVTIVGPRKPSTVLLVHKQSRKKTQIDISSVQTTNPFEVTHQIRPVYSTHRGSYYFKIVIGPVLEFESMTVQLNVKQRCRLLTTPPNTELTEEEIEGSDNYRVVVACTDPSYVFLHPDETAVICDTGSGTYNVNRRDYPILTPCLRTINPEL